jgi:hypothetical protein
MPVAFSLREHGVLWCDDVCTYARVSSSVSAESALAALLAYARAHHASHFVSPGAAVAVLLSCGVSVSVVEDQPRPASVVTRRDATTELALAPVWSLQAFLLGIAPSEPTSPVAAVLRVHGLRADELLAPTSQRWSLVHWSREHQVRLLTETPPTEDAAPRVVFRRYVSGVRVHHASAPASSSVTVHVDEFFEGDTPPDVPHVHSAAVVGRVFLCPRMVAHLTDVPSLAATFDRLTRRSAHALARHWYHCTDHDLLRIVCDPRTPDAVLRCVDANVVLRCRRFVEDVNTTGLVVLRRLEAEDATRTTDWLARVRLNYGIARVEVLPVSHAALVALTRTGSLARAEAVVGVCDDGLVLEASSDRLLLVPYDYTQATLARCALTLLTGTVADATDAPTPQAQRFGFGVVYSETSTHCPVPDALTLLYVTVHAETDERVVVLTPAPDEEVLRSDDQVLSVDALRSVPCSAARRWDLRRVLPRLHARLVAAAHGDAASLVACLREVQGRRVQREWTLEGLDTGDNLSSLGMSVLLAVALNGWLGARVRVAQSRTLAAMVAVWMDDGRFRLVDPTRTLCNFTTLAAAAPSPVAPPPVVPLPPAVGEVVEVRAARVWMVGLVRTVHEHLGTMVVEAARTRTRRTVSVRSQLWRRVFDNNSDAHDVLRPLLRSHLKRGRDADGERLHS